MKVDILLVLVFLVHFEFEIIFVSGRRIFRIYGRGERGDIPFKLIFLAYPALEKFFVSEFLLLYLALEVFFISRWRIFRACVRRESGDMPFACCCW